MIRLALTKYIRKTLTIPGAVMDSYMVIDSR